MKCGGLYNALKIASAAEVYGVECMIGCMLEAKISVNAAVHLACAKQIITRVDLDGPVLCSEDPILGGAVFNEKEITVSNEPGPRHQGHRAGQDQVFGLICRKKYAVHCCTAYFYARILLFVSRMAFQVLPHAGHRAMSARSLGVWTCSRFGPKEMQSSPSILPERMPHSRPA